MAIPPAFNSNRISLLDRGWACAIAHIRGGTDKGWGWYLDGKREKKTNSFDDFSASARALIPATFVLTIALVLLRNRLASDGARRVGNAANCRGIGAAGGRNGLWRRRAQRDRGRARLADLRGPRCRRSAGQPGGRLPRSAADDRRRGHARDAVHGVGQPVRARLRGGEGPRARLLDQRLQCFRPARGDGGVPDPLGVEGEGRPVLRPPAPRRASGQAGRTSSRRARTAARTSRPASSWRSW